MRTARGSLTATRPAADPGDRRALDVAPAGYPAFCAALYGRLRPGGRLLIQQMSRGSRRPVAARSSSPTSPPTGLRPVREAGFEVIGVEDGQIMDRGLWRYTRHPNYFGDFCMWWGLFAISAGSWRELPALAGPLLMSFILIRGTGARMTDRRMTASRPQYADYVARTSGFIPLPPKRAPKRSAAAAAPGERA